MKCFPHKTNVLDFLYEPGRSIVTETGGFKPTVSVCRSLQKQQPCSRAQIFLQESTIGTVKSVLRMQNFTKIDTFNSHLLIERMPLSA